jgi:hypothetical protein
MDDQRDYAEEAANQRLMEEEHQRFDDEWIEPRDNPNDLVDTFDMFKDWE